MINGALLIGLMITEALLSKVADKSFLMKKLSLAWVLS